MLVFPSGRLLAQGQGAMVNGERHQRKVQTLIPATKKAKHVCAKSKP